MDDNIKTYMDFEKHLLEDEQPSDYFNQIFQENSFADKHPFNMLNKLKHIKQSPKYHPEGSVWNHTMLVIDYAASKKDQSSNPKFFMWAALLHDLGKIPATKIKKGRVTAYAHDRLGEKLAIDFLEALDADKNTIYAVSKMVRWHMQILYLLKDLPFADIKTMLTEVTLEDIALLSLCDRLGRGNISPSCQLEEEKNVRLFIEKCKQT